MAPASSTSSPVGTPAITANIFQAERAGDNGDYDASA
jgi:hypothetical protein